MNTKTIISLGVLGAACIVVYKRVAAKTAERERLVKPTLPGFFGGLSAVSHKALGLAPLTNEAYQRLGYTFQPGPDGWIPLIPRPVDSGLFEGTYSPAYLSGYNLGGY